MWQNPQFPTDLVTFTEEILNGKLHFYAVTGDCYHDWIFISFDYGYYNTIQLSSDTFSSRTNFCECLFMCKWNSSARIFPPEFKSVICKRYVDDTFLLFQNINQAEKFRNYINLQHANIRFTLKLKQMICSHFLPLKSLEKTTNSLPKFIVSLNLVVFSLTLQFLYLIHTNKS